MIQSRREKLYIGKDKPFITMVGIGDPVIVWNDTKADAGNRTFESATFGVGGDFFLAVNMTFQVCSPETQFTTSVSLNPKLENKNCTSLSHVCRFLNRPSTTDIKHVQDFH